MTEKEFHKLRRRDLLQLLVTQGKENIQLQEELDITRGELEQSQESNGRLKAKLDEKDALIEKLKGRLDEKDAKIHQLREEMAQLRVSRRIELEKSGSIAEAALKINGVFEAAQRAADQYLGNIREKYGGIPMESPRRPDNDETQSD